MGEVLHVGLAVKHGHDLRHVLIQQHVVVGLFFEQTAGINELGGGIHLVFGQHQNVHGNGGAKKQIGRQGNHAFYIVVINQIFADFLLCPAPVEDARKAHNRRPPFARQVAERVHHKRHVGLGLGGQHAGRGKAVVVDQRGVVAANPFHRVRRVGDDGIKRLVVSKLGVFQRVAQRDVEFVVIHIVQKHVHPRQVVRGVVEFLPKKAVFNDVRIKVFFGLQQQRSRSAGRVINFVDAGLLVHGQLRNQLGDVLGRKKLAPRFARIGGVVGDQKLIRIAKQVNLVVAKFTKIELGHALEHRRQAPVFVGHGVAQAVAGGVKVGKQPLNVVLGGVALGRGLDGFKNVCQVGVQAVVGVGRGRHIGKQLAGVDEIALGFDGIVANVGRDDGIVQLGVLNAVIPALDVAGKVLADKAVEQRAQHVLLEVPAVHGPPDIVGDLPNAALQFCALLCAGHGD